MGCEQFENQRVIVVNSDEVSTVTVRCYKVLGVPSMCAYIDETTRTVRIEDVVTRIIERIVSQKVITEVPVEKIVTQIETRYIDKDQEVNIEEMVITIIERIKKYVQAADIIDVPIKDIVDETTDYISDAPRPDDNTDVPFISTPIGDIKSEDDPKTDDVSTPNDGNTPNGETTNGDDTSNGETTNGDNTPNEGGPDNNKPLINPGDDNSGNNDIVVDGDNVKLRVTIGPKRTTTRPSINQPGLSFKIECDIDGNIMHPEIGTYSIFRGDNYQLWGYQGWCQVPEGLDASNITIYVTRQ